MTSLQFICEDVFGGTNSIYDCDIDQIVFFLLVLWAQRSSDSDAAKNYLDVFLSVPDVPKSSAKLNITPTSISFAGHSETKKVDYKVDLELFGEIDVDNSKIHHSPRGVDLVLRKKELKLEYWPRLLKEAKKVHFLKTNFDKVGLPLPPLPAPLRTCLLRITSTC